MKGKGWHDNSYGHKLASKGIRTPKEYFKGNPIDLPVNTLDILNEDAWDYYDKMGITPDEHDIIEYIANHLIKEMNMEPRLAFNKAGDYVCGCESYYDEYGVRKPGLNERYLPQAKGFSEIPGGIEVADREAMNLYGKHYDALTPQERRDINKHIKQSGLDLPAYGNDNKQH